MENNYTVLILFACLILSLVWKNISDDKKANRDKSEFNDLIGSRAIHVYQTENLIKKMKHDASNYESTIAKLELDVQTLNTTIVDLHRKLDNLDNKKAE